MLKSLLSMAISAHRGETMSKAMGMKSVESKQSGYMNEFCPYMVIWPWAMPMYGHMISHIQG